MDSFVLRWRALVWGRVWGSVAVLTLAWSIGAGLAIRAVLLKDQSPGMRHWCELTPVQPLVETAADWLSLPVRALVAAPLGLYESGLLFGLAAFAFAVVPAALLQQGTARRVLGAPVIALLAVLLLVLSWHVQLATIARTGVPSLACSN
jgi:hypothetical protein